MVRLVFQYFHIESGEERRVIREFCKWTARQCAASPIYPTIVLRRSAIPFPERKRLRPDLGPALGSVACRNPAQYRPCRHRFSPVKRIDHDFSNGCTIGEIIKWIAFERFCIPVNIRRRIKPRSRQGYPLEPALMG